MTTIHTMEQCASELARARRLLADRLADGNRELAAVMARRRAEIKASVEAVAGLEEELIGRVDDNPDLFKRPQSIEVDGVRFGWRKGKGRIEYADEAKLIERIEDKLTKAQRESVLR
jgi:hypothetical protein